MRIQIINNILTFIKCNVYFLVPDQTTRLQPTFGRAFLAAAVQNRQSVTQPEEVT